VTGITPDTGADPARHTHPIVFLFLILPFGVMGGYLSVTVAYLLSQGGISVAETAALIALGLLPHTWKFAWAPIADTTLTRKRWYLISSVVSAVGIWATGIFPAREEIMPLLSVVVFSSNVAVTFLGMAVESLMAYATPENEKGRAGGWFQAGNLGGAGLGGGLGLVMAKSLPAPWMSGAILGAACFLCSLGLLFVTEPAAAHRAEKLGKSLVNVGIDLWRVARSRIGLLALILCVLPIGSGAAGGLWSAVAGDWKASANTVAIVTGVLGGIFSAAGCLLGGWICDRMNRKTAYAVYGVLQALCAIAMAAAPRTEWMYIVFTSLYALITGLTFAGFTAFVLEAMGRGAAATKYNVFASLSNTPIYYMTQIDGWAHTRWGPAAMLRTEALFGFIGLLAFMAVMAIDRKRQAGQAGQAA
jgi:MFS transporter, PAT family, beta-lactamase induction signal transducer AmpG